MVTRFGDIPVVMDNVLDGGRPIILRALSRFVVLRPWDWVCPCYRQKS